jgi:glycosyltransferase involved in cell wall biosynthesis
MSWLKTKGLVKYAIFSEFDALASKAINWADVIILNKHSSNEAFSLATQAKEQNKRIIYDIDDYIFNVPKSLNVFTRNSIESRRIIDLSDVIVVENNRLFNKVRDSHSNVIIIPNGIHTETYPAPQLAKEQLQRYIFSTYVPTLDKFVSTFIKVLRTFQETHKWLTFDLYGNNAMNFPIARNIPICSYKDYMTTIIATRAFMAVVPLWGKEDTENVEYRESKSAIKYIMYGYAGIPAIYTNVLPYSAHVQNNETGLLVENTYDAWLDGMSRLASDYVLREKIRRNAYADICMNYHIRKSAKMYYEILL